MFPLQCEEAIAVLGCKKARTRRLQRQPVLDLEPSNTKVTSCLPGNSHAHHHSHTQFSNSTQSVAADTLPGSSTRHCKGGSGNHSQSRPSTTGARETNLSDSGRGFEARKGQYFSRCSGNDTKVLSSKGRLDCGQDGYMTHKNIGDVVGQSGQSSKFYAARCKDKKDAVKGINMQLTRRPENSSEPAKSIYQSWEYHKHNKPRTVMVPKIHKTETKKAESIGSVVKINQHSEQEKTAKAEKMLQAFG